MQFTALDRVAVERRRTHEFLNPETGRIEFFRFEPDVATPVPREFALLLAKSADFLVTDEAGQVLRIVDTPAGDRPVLAADQTIARYTELSQEALVARVLAAGGKAGKTTARTEMIAFLVNEASRPDDDGESTLDALDDAAD
jgi:hypothetical protein